MYQVSLKPRFNETDALGHISNTVLPSWFETARAPLFDEIVPSLTIEEWPIILAHLDVDFHNQIFLGTDVVITTRILKIGSKSFTVFHEAWQGERKTASGHAVLVYFDYRSQSTIAIPDTIRATLEKRLAEGEGRGKGKGKSEK